MTTDPTFRDWPRLNGDALTGSLGDDASGWATELLDVSAYEGMALELTLAGGSGDITLQLLSADRNALTLAEACPDIEDDGSGNLTDLTLTWTSPGAAAKRILRLDARGMSKLSLVASGSGTLTVRELGWGKPLPRRIA